MGVPYRVKGRILINNHRAAGFPLRFCCLRISGPPQEIVLCVPGWQLLRQLCPYPFGNRELHWCRIRQAAVGVEGDGHRPLYRIQFPQGVKHHIALPAVILQRVSRLVFSSCRVRIRCPSHKGQASVFRQFFCQHGILPLRNNLGSRRLSAPVGVIDDIPAVPGDVPLRPERHVLYKGNRRARSILCSGAVFGGIPAGKDPAALLRDLARDPHIRRHGRHNGNWIRYSCCGIRQRILERQRHGFLLAPDGIEFHIPFKHIRMARQVCGLCCPHILVPPEERISAACRENGIPELYPGFRIHPEIRG